MRAIADFQLGLYFKRFQFEFALKERPLEGNQTILVWSVGIREMFDLCFQGITGFLAGMFIGYIRGSTLNRYLRIVRYDGRNNFVISFSIAGQTSLVAR